MDTSSPLTFACDAWSFARAQVSAAYINLQFFDEFCGGDTTI